jgi:hypothetical protein
VTVESIEKVQYSCLLKASEVSLAVIIKDENERKWKRKIASALCLKP